MFSKFRFFILTTSALAFSFSASVQSAGWSKLPNTTLNSVCPEKNFNGYDYDFAYRCKNVTLAWSGGAFDKSGNRLLIWGGGHNDYYGNEIYAVDLDDNSIYRITDPAQPADPSGDTRSSELSPYDGTQPNSRHTYDGVSYMSNHNLMWVFSGSLAGTTSNVSDNLTWVFDLANNSWKLDNAKGDIPDGGVGIVSAYDEVSGKVYFHNRKGFYSYEYKEDGGVYTKLLDDNNIGLGVNAEIDPVNRKFVVLGNSHQAFFELDEDKGHTRVDLPLKGDSDFLKNNSAPGIAFNDNEQTLYAWVGDGRVYYFDNETSAWVSIAFSGGPGQQVKNGTFGRFAYSAESDLFVVYNNSDQNAFTFFKPQGQDTEAPAAPTNISFSYPYPGGFQIDWTPSNDNFGVAHYFVRINGEQLVESRTNTFKSAGFEHGSNLTIEIAAQDSAGNQSSWTEVMNVSLPTNTLGGPLGNCSAENQLADRDDVVFCEPWENASWYIEGEYLSDPIVDDPRPMDESHAVNTEIVDQGCISGKCLKVNMVEGQTKGLSAYWPFKNANQAPENVFVRYYMKLANDWDVKMCKSDGSVAGAGGKFPGLADVRTWKDPGGQCGNGGASGDGLNCWSMRLNYRDCSSSDGEACATKPEAAMRLGSYLYHAEQAGSTGDAGHWDADDWGQSRGSGGICEENPGNLFCGKEDHGVFERDIWYQVEMQVKMNTSGQADGVIRGWINGNLAYEKTNVIFREKGHDFLHNRLMWLNVFKGGVYGNCQSSSVYFDQMVFALDKPIGSIEGAETQMPPKLSLNVDQLDVSSSDMINVTWQAENAIGCEAHGLWQGDKGLSGEQVLGPMSESGYIRMDCQGTGGSVSRQLALIVDGEPIGGSPSQEVLAQPSGLTLEEMGDNFVTINWDEADTSEEVDIYYVRSNGALVAQVNSAQFTHFNILAGSELTYTVQALSSEGNFSPVSDELVVVVPSSDEAANTLVLYPDSDTYVASSTLSALGSKEHVEVSGKMNGLIRFPVELLGRSQVYSARLTLHSLREYGNYELGIFNVDKEWNESATNRKYALVSLQQLWDNELGDWSDANGVQQGDTPYASVDLIDDDLPNDIEIDVTDLVNEWLTSGVNYGMMLKRLSGTSRHFASKENVEQHTWPKLTLVLEDGEYTSERQATQDTFLSSSTNNSLGSLPYLHLSTATNSLVEFSIDDLQWQKVTKAELVLHTRAEYGNITVGLFVAIADWDERTASRHYSSTGIHWFRELGDWEGADGTEFGSVPLATIYNRDDDQSNEVRFDLTPYLDRWSGTDKVSLMIRKVSGGSIHFHSKEASSLTLRPSLHLTHER